MKTNELTPKNHLNDNFYSAPGITRQMMTTKQVKETMLATENFIIAHGKSWKLKVKNAGAGMKEITLIPFES